MMLKFRRSKRSSTNPLNPPSNENCCDNNSSISEQNNMRLTGEVRTVNGIKINNGSNSSVKIIVNGDDEPQPGKQWKSGVSVPISNGIKRIFDDNSGNEKRPPLPPVPIKKAPSIPTPRVPLTALIPPPPPPPPPPSWPAPTGVVHVAGVVKQGGRYVKNIQEQNCSKQGPIAIPRLPNRDFKNAQLLFSGKSSGSFAKNFNEQDNHKVEEEPHCPKRISPIEKYQDYASLEPHRTDYHYDSSCSDNVKDVNKLLTNIKTKSLADLSRELRTIFDMPVFNSLVQTHDEIGKTLSEQQSINDCNSDYQDSASVGSIETPLDCRHGNVRMVKIYKNGDRPLGATVVQEGNTIAISRIIKGGIAEKSGLLNEGDVIVEVNGARLRNKSVNEVCDLLSNLRGELTFLISPAKIDTVAEEPDNNAKHMKALFDYDPKDDHYLPCREIGLPFQKGDILHIISTADPNWWQAQRDGENSTLAGLIPSANFQLQRECCRLESEDACRRSSRVKKTQRQMSVDRENETKFWSINQKIHKKRSTSVFISDGKKIASISIGNNALSIKKEGNEPLDIFTYEEVCWHLIKGKKRPVVLIGPMHVGQRQILRRLIELQPDKLAKVVHHTSRPIKPEETSGVRYHFLPRQQFQNYINEKKFIEWGEYDKHLYGTSYESVQRVIEQGKTCILLVKPQSIKSIRNAEIKPFIVYITPPPFERLKINVYCDAVSSGRLYPGDEELRKVFNEASQIEETYGHYFDKKIVNYDIDTSVQELIKIIRRLETEPQWIPATWVNTVQLA